MQKFIINFAPTGIIPTKEMTPHVPVRPEKIISEVLEAKKYGVSMVHLHARRANGEPAWERDIYRETIHGIREADVYSNHSLILRVSTSGRKWADFKRRSQCLELEAADKPDMASLTLSSLNFPRSTSPNSPKMIYKLATKMMDKGIKPELEVFDSGMINYAKYLHKKGLIHPPLYFNIILGNIATAQAGLLDAGYLISQLPANSYWSLGGIGSAQLTMNVIGILYGGGIRIGLEDNIYFDEERSRLATNLELLERISDIAAKLGKTPFSPMEARRILDLEIK